MIKYIGSKRRLVPVLAAMAERSGATTALDLFTGTTRVAQAFKQLGIEVTATDAARYAEILARCTIATDARTVDGAELADALARLDALPGRPGYVTETFCERARFFQPHNGARIDAIRDAIDRHWRGHALEPVLLASLLQAADRVDSTTGVQMAYVKAWAPRSYRPLELRPPALLDGPGHAHRGDACALAPALGPFDLAYLDPPYNQHRYESNYHIWETLVAWDAPEHYGVACKRVDLREPGRSPFNQKRTIRAALAGVLADVRARVVVLSYNDESWVGLDELVELCSVRGHVAVLAFTAGRYVGAIIGVHDPSGARVGTPGRLRNVEYVLVSGDGAEVEHLTAPWRAATPERPIPLSVAARESATSGVA